LKQLVNQNVASGANFTFETEAPTQQKGLTEGATIGEFREIKVNAFNAFKVHFSGIVIIGQSHEMQGVSYRRIGVGNH
jgi:hypothetical protein